MKKIFGLELKKHAICTLKMQESSKILSVDELDSDHLVLWILSGVGEYEYERIFEVFTDSSEIYSEEGVKRNFIGSVKESTRNLTWHVFERIN